MKTDFNENKSYAIFILSFKRAKKVITYKTLKKLNAKNIYIVVSDDDPTIEEYKALYENVLVFEKKKYVNTSFEFDAFHNNPPLNTPLYARNAVYDLAKQIGFRYFIVLDDDYGRFEKIVYKDGHFVGKKITDWHKYFDKLFDFYVNNPNKENMKVLSISQAGDYILGKDHMFKDSEYSYRKSMNFFLSDTERRIYYVAYFDDDTSTYVAYDRTTAAFLTFPFLCLTQVQTQKNPGGITEAYKEQGTYIKSFMPILISPVGCRISKLGRVEPRIHHHVRWNMIVPKIIPHKYI